MHQPDALTSQHGQLTAIEIRDCIGAQRDKLSDEPKNNRSPWKGLVAMKVRFRSTASKAKAGCSINNLLVEAQYQGETTPNLVVEERSGSPSVLVCRTSRERQKWESEHSSRLLGLVMLTGRLVSGAVAAGTKVWKCRAGEREVALVSRYQHSAAGGLK
jgi:hypothetical protein